MECQSVTKISSCAFTKIRGFNAVNRLRGYKEVEIYSPLEITP